VSYTVAETGGDYIFRDWTVFRDDAPVLRAGGRRTPDNVLELVAVQWGAPSNDICLPASELLLNHVASTAARQRYFAVRTLVWDNDPLFPDMALRTAGFGIVATLQGWTAPMTVAPAPEHSLTIQRRSLHQLSLHEQKASRLTRLLQECLRDSQDLQMVPALSEATLMANWQALDRSQMIIASIEGHDVGLAVVNQEVVGRGATLEYLGISVRFRRLGYGRTVLREALAASCLRDPYSESHPAALTAWCDQENRPAMQLYQNCGFEPAGTGQLWIHSVQQH